ncbi:hypothetical protein GC194_15430 [bacterium]|nr:hypothetical protein [bacterium]
MSQSKPNLWPLGIVITLVIFAGFIVSIAVYISKKHVDLVSKEYYAESVAYNNVIDMKKAYELLEEKPVINLSGESQQVLISFPSSYLGKVSNLSVEFYKPDNANLDFKLPLELKHGNQLQIDSEKMATGMWNVKLFFNLEDTKYLHEQNLQI